MFNKKYEDRLRSWVEFRDFIETSADPIQECINFYRNAPTVNIQVDPWDANSWLNPWELLRENRYCEFSIILGICYSLQLTDSFLDAKFVIHICTNTADSEVKYLLSIDDKVIGYDPERWVDKSELPETLRIEIAYEMPSLQ
jgi:hypothetical protein